MYAKSFRRVDLKKNKTEKIERIMLIWFENIEENKANIILKHRIKGNSDINFKKMTRSIKVPSVERGQNGRMLLWVGTGQGEGFWSKCCLS